MSFSQGINSGLQLGQAFRQSSDRREKERLRSQFSDLRGQIDTSKPLSGQDAFKQMALLNPDKAKKIQAVLKTDKQGVGALFEDALFTQQQLLNDPTGQSAVNFLNSRVQAGEPNRNMFQTEDLINTIQNNGAEAGLKAIDGIVNVYNQLRNPTGAAKKTADQLERELIVKEGALDARRQEIRQRQAEAGKVKLSPKGEEALINSQDKFFESGKTARKMELLVNDFAKLDVSGGLASTVSETFKNILGSQDEVTAIRKKFNGIRSSQAVNDLPPGAASDADIQLALDGFPEKNANAEQITGFLRGQSKLARIDERFNEFKAQYISEKNSVKGLIKNWKQKLSDPEFLSDILTPKDIIKDTLKVGDLSDEDLFN